jgi:hypothetical protein
MRSQEIWKSLEELGISTVLLKKWKIHIKKL